MQFTADSIILDRPELRALIAHSSKDETRPHLCAVAFFPAARHAASTDGHRLAVCCTTDTGATWPATIVPRSALDRAYKLSKTGDQIHIFPADCAIKVVRVGAPETLVITFEPVTKGPFPPYTQIIPKYPLRSATTGWALSARYLADLQLVAEATNARTAEVRAFAPGSELDPIVFTAGGAGLSEWTVVIMPIRSDAPEIREATKETNKRNDRLAKADRAIAIEDELRVTLEAVKRKVAEDAAVAVAAE